MNTLKSFNPANGEVVGEVPITQVEEIGGIVARSRLAQQGHDGLSGWGGLSVAERVEILRPVGAKLGARAPELGRLLTLEMGKPLREGIGEVKACAGGEDGRGWIEELDEIAAAIAPETIEDDSKRSTIYRDPYGVCAAITPWNFPMLMVHWQVLPALVAGNTVVLKPSEETPLIAQAYADALNEVLPADVLIVVHGDERQGRALVAADVDLITFTGSRGAGKHILAEASKGLKRVILELGGKDPLVVLPGADVRKAAEFAARNGFRNAGQVCVSTERVYVHKDIEKPFVDALLIEAGKYAPGPGIEDKAAIGPMVNARQRDHVLRQVREAVKQGATIACGPDVGSAPASNFVAPIVLTNVTHEMEVAREETFGPVLTVTTVADDGEALRLANDTKFGLGAVVFGEPGRAAKLARRLCSGMIGINRGIGGAKGPKGGTPWVGARESGYGFHSGPEGHRQFCQVRVVSEGK
jgi:succinate-semialdehyde dehydrogenase/glutarate-semialdehyde dehydrogenase